MRSFGCASVLLPEDFRSGHGCRARSGPARKEKPSPRARAVPLTARGDHQASTTQGSSVVPRGPFERRPTFSVEPALPNGPGSALRYPAATRRVTRRHSTHPPQRSTFVPGKTVAARRGIGARHARSRTSNGGRRPAGPASMVGPGALEAEATGSWLARVLQPLAVGVVIERGREFESSWTRPASGR